MMPESHSHFLFKPRLDRGSDSDLAPLGKIEHEVRLGNIRKIEELKEAIESRYPMGCPIGTRKKEPIFVKSKLPGMKAKCRKVPPSQLCRNEGHFISIVVRLVGNNNGQNRVGVKGLDHGGKPLEYPFRTTDHSSLPSIAVNS
jgi:hypothetical protein